jgi:hypothetical protein
MALSLVVIGANAAFTDVTADTDYSEAINVLTGIGVINGMTSTTFAPDGSLTREQAAKIICYMMLGPTNAELVSSATTAKFDDVAADRWSAGYIEYCANLGIINGVGDNKFAPEATLTTAAFTKMLLCALGYKADVEGFTGASWAINVASTAVTAGVYDSDIAISASTNITRGQACQLAFLTLQATTVQYVGGSTMTVNGVTITTGATRSEVVNNTSTYDPSDTTYETDGTKQFCEKYFSKLKLSATTGDSFGRPAHEWVYGTPAKSLGVYTDTPVLTYTAKFTAATLYKDLGGAYNITSTVNSSAAQTTDTIASVLAGTDIYGGNGVITEIYKTSSTPTYAAVQIVPSFGKVTAVATTKATTTHGAYTTYTIGSESGKVFSTVVDSTADVDTASVTGTVAKGDYVLYYYDGATTPVLYIEAVDTISGILTAVSSADVHTISGATYKLAACGVAGTPSTKTQSFYVDSYNNILGAVEPTTSSNFGLLLNVKNISTVGTDSVITTTPTAYVATSDGSVVVLKMASSTAIPVGSLVTYAVNTSVTTYTAYTLADVSDVATYASVASYVTAFTKSTNLLTTNYAVDSVGSTAATCKYADANTLFVFADYDSDGAIAGTVTTYTGIANVPTYASMTQAYAVDTNATAADSVANVVFVYDNVAATTSANLVYVLDSYNTTATAKVYDTIVAGEVSTISVGLLQSLDAGMYSSITVTGGVPTAVDATALTSVNGIKVSSGLFYTTTNSGTSYSVYTVPAIVTTAPVYVIHTDSGTCDTYTAADIDELVGASAVYVTLNTAGTAVAAVYMTYAD